MTYEDLKRTCLEFEEEYGAERLLTCLEAIMENRIDELGIDVDEEYETLLTIALH